MVVFNLKNIRSISSELQPRVFEVIFGLAVSKEFNVNVEDTDNPYSTWYI
jgi:hypothetical protein